MKYVELNNGIKMSILGYGVFQIADHKECERCVLDTIDVGYRLIDTSQSYGNEEAVGDKYKKSIAQVALRYLIQRGVSVIPKSVSKERMKANFYITSTKSSNIICWILLRDILILGTIYIKLDNFILQ